MRKTLAKLKGRAIQKGQSNLAERAGGESHRGSALDRAIEILLVSSKTMTHLTIIKARNKRQMTYSN
jgi:hypothetical protein